MTVETIYLCPYTHADWAWTAYRQWHAKRYIRGFEITLDLMDEHPEFTWFIDTWTDQFRPVFENRPDLVERIRPRVAEKRFGLAGGHYANPHPDRCGRETYVRNTLYGQRHFLEVFPEAEFPAATHMDVIIGHSQLPQLLTKMGFIYYYGCRSQAAQDALGVPAQFRWRGLDGSVIACERGHYGCGCSSNLENWPEARKCFTWVIEEVERLGSGPLVSVRFGEGDDCLPLGDPTRPMPLFEFIKAWNSRETVQLRFGTPAAFGRELAARDDLPEWEGPLDCVGWSYWHGQIGRDSLWRLRMQADRALCQAELASLHAGDSEDDAFLEALWADLLSTHSHATLWLWEPDYEAFLDRVKQVIRSASEVRDEARREIAEQIRPAIDGRPVVIFNPLPFDRDEVCQFFFPIDEAGPTGLVVVDGEENVLPCQFANDSMCSFGRADDGKLRLRECRVAARVKVPASGHAVVYVRPDNTVDSAARFEPAPKRVKAGTLAADTSNGYLDSIAFGKLGALVERLDLVFEEIEESSANARAHRANTLTGPDAPPADPARESSAVTNMHDGPVIGRESFHVEDWSLMASGPLGARVFFNGDVAGNPAELEVFLHADGGRIDCEARIYVVKPKSGYFLASVKPSFEGQLHVDVPFGVEARSPEREPYDGIERTRFESFWGHSWVDLSDGKRGVAIFSEPGQQGYRWKDGRLEHFLLKTIAPENMFGGRWVNKHRTGLGYQDFRFALFLHEGDWRAARLYREIERYRQPLDGTDALYKLEGDEPDTARGLAVGPENVMLSGFFRDGEKIILRIYENEGRATTAEVELPFTAEGVGIVDLLNRPTDDKRTVRCDGASVALDLASWEIVTLCLEIAAEDCE